jgi:hypothetical protein
MKKPTLVVEQAVLCFALMNFFDGAAQQISDT